MTKDIKITHKGEDYIKVEYKQNNKTEEAEITGIAIEIIEKLCQALHKPFPKDYEFES